MTAAEGARFAELFAEVYLRFHVRRPPTEPRVTPQAWAMLQHLAATGPLTVGEAALHFGRAQSVVSESLEALVTRGLLERMTDPRDRRRTLVWLTDEGQALLARERRVLDEDRLAAALVRLAPAQREGLLQGMAALSAAAPTTPGPKQENER